MKHFLRIVFLLVTFTSQIGNAQSKKILFLGNSYTAANNLPLLLKNIALSTNDTLTIDSNTPGGYTFQLHSTNAASLSKINAGNWDFVVLQEQSQLPSFPDSQVQAETFPYARFLDSMINQISPCAETVFYRTWGRKNGDATNCGAWPPVCTYDGMDSLLHLRYMKMAADNHALLSPVGVVWKYLRTTHPEIELYASDGSHPSAAGSYAAACSFYSVILRKNPLEISYNFGLADTVALHIKEAAELMVYDSLSKWFVGKYDPVANWDYTATDNVFNFQNLSSNADEYLWDFGDGSTSNTVQPTHSFALPGIYTVSLTSKRCGNSSVRTGEINVTVLQQHQFFCYPNPVHGSCIISSHSSLAGRNYFLYNAAGQLMKKGILNHNFTPFETSNLSAGMYVLKIEGTDTKPISVVKQE